MLIKRFWCRVSMVLFTEDQSECLSDPCIKNLLRLSELFKKSMYVSVDRGTISTDCPENEAIFPLKDTLPL